MNNKQLSEKNRLLEAELASNQEEFKSLRGQRKKIDDQLRAEKDRLSNYELDLKRVRMEAEIIEKDKNNEINRLKKII